MVTRFRPIAPRTQAYMRICFVCKWTEPGWRELLIGWFGDELFCVAASGAQHCACITSTWLAREGQILCTMRAGMEEGICILPYNKGIRAWQPVAKLKQTTEACTSLPFGCIDIYFEGYIYDETLTKSKVFYIFLGFICTPMHNVASPQLTPHRAGCWDTSNQSSPTSIYKLYSVFVMTGTVTKEKGRRQGEATWASPQSWLQLTHLSLREELVLSNLLLPLCELTIGIGGVEKGSLLLYCSSCRGMC